MKTGRLIKFRRAGADVHAYLYGEGGRFQAALYLIDSGRRGTAPEATLSGTQEAEVEAAVRAWVEERFPRGR